MNANDPNLELRGAPPIESGMDQSLAAAAIVKARRRLLPFLFVLYIVAYLDRINVGFAALEMNRDLGLSDTVFGLGAGLFFVGYFLFEIPSNLILARVGARRWIARIMVSWGVMAIAMAFVRGAASFYAMRILLGVAEAGFFPGIILYLTYWFPPREQARAIATFMTATAIAGVIAGAVSGALLTMHGFAGLAGWQWLFIVEGAPAIVLGFVVARLLPNGIADARWLSEPEREALATRLAEERRRTQTSRGHQLGDALRSAKVWTLAAIYFTVVLSLYGLSFWLPSIVKQMGARSDLEVGFIAAIPFVLEAISMVQVSKSSDRLGERRLHVAASAFVGCAGFALAAAARQPTIVFAAICVAAAGVGGFFGPFWSIPAEHLSGVAAAGGIALINSVGNLGGFVGPYAVGFIRQHSAGFTGAFTLLAASLLVATCLALGIARSEWHRQRQ
jgi:MFS transporter, ACS family, tartrate transporter